MSLNDETNGRFMVHALQLSPLNSFKAHEFCQFVNLGPKCEKTVSFRVEVKRLQTLQTLITLDWFSAVVLAKGLLNFYGWDSCCKIT